MSWLRVEGFGLARSKKRADPVQKAKAHTTTSGTRESRALQSGEAKVDTSSFRIAESAVPGSSSQSERKDQTQIRESTSAFDRLHRHVCTSQGLRAQIRDKPCRPVASHLEQSLRRSSSPPTVRASCTWKHSTRTARSTFGLSPFPSLKECDHEHRALFCSAWLSSASPSRPPQWERQQSQQASLAGTIPRFSHPWRLRSRS
jgi:hypothetical protein